MPSPPKDEIDPKLRTSLNKLSPEDRRLAIAQRWCPVMDDSRLGSMGMPVKVMIDSKPVFLCCEGCKEAALEKSDETLARVKELMSAKKSSSMESTR